ncbi:hypothetical protein JCM11491_004718 [Sporobolomyces phaffii]
MAPPTATPATSTAQAPKAIRLTKPGNLARAYRDWSEFRTAAHAFAARFGFALKSGGGYVGSIQLCKTPGCGFKLKAARDPSEEIKVLVSDCNFRHSHDCVDRGTSTLCWSDKGQGSQNSIQKKRPNPPVKQEEQQKKVKLEAVDEPLPESDVARVQALSAFLAKVKVPLADSERIFLAANLTAPLLASITLGELPIVIEKLKSAKYGRTSLDAIELSVFERQMKRWIQAEGQGVD